MQSVLKTLPISELHLLKNIKGPWASNSRFPSIYSSYLKDGGESGRLTRSFDWCQTSLGHPGTWTQGQLTAVSILLNSQIPMILWWGPDYIQFCNDAYIQNLGANRKHLVSVGSKGEDYWVETWPYLKVSIDQVFSGGESTLHEDMPVPVYIDGKPVDASATFSYSRVNDDTGEPVGVLVIIHVRVEKIQIDHAIKEGKRQLAFVLEAAELGTWDYDLLTGTTVNSERMKSWFGLVEDQEFTWEVMQKNVSSEDAASILEKSYEAANNGSGGDYSATYTILESENIPRRVVRAVGKMAFNSIGEPYRFSGIAQDITQEYDVQQKKDEFLSVASHELKTPLTSIKASLQLLDMLITKDLNSEKIPMLIGKANKNVNKLSDIIEDLVNVTLIQQGRMGIVKESFSIASLINTCCEQGNFNESHEILVTGDLDCQVFADEKRIEQVLVNYISNAVKYAPLSKRIEISIHNLELIVKVIVKDFGIGISPEHLPQIFDRYYRADHSGLEYSGMGLGLYIGSGIIHQHGGKVGAESIPGAGSEFWFTLPASP